MAKQKDLDVCYMHIAEAHAGLSKAIRAKVGAAIVTPSGAILGGFNGTPNGYDNACEYIDPETGELITKDVVVHAEGNAIAAAARTGVSLKGSTCYVTLSPCAKCSAIMKQVGISRVVYKDSYKNSEGIDMLTKLGVIIEQFKE